jgi:hypothetical protein
VLPNDMAMIQAMNAPVAQARYTVTVNYFTLRPLMTGKAPR